MFCSQLSLPWQNFIKEYVRKKKLITRKEFRGNNVLFSINKKIDIRLRDLVKTKTINLRGILSLSRHESGLYSKIFNKKNLSNRFTGTFCEMVYTVSEALFEEYGVNIINAPLSIKINPNYKAQGQGNFNPKVERVLLDLNEKKEFWDKEKK